MEKYNYKIIYAIVKEDILKGVYPTGTLMPTELTLAEKYNVSRPTISKVYNQLQVKGYVLKKKGLGTIVLFKESVKKVYTFGLLFPGDGESEIFSIINDQILKKSEEMKFNCLWEGATASNADIRRNLIETCCNTYIEKKVDGIFFSPLERIPDAERININICNKIRKAGIPLVLIDRDIVPAPEKSPFDIVCLDNFNAGCVMAQHLINAHCTQIYFFQRPDSAYSVRSRLLGVREIVQKYGMIFNNQNELCGNPEDVELIKNIPIEKGKAGIICANDATAAVLMSSLEGAGYVVGVDILICGFDNMKYSQYLKCSLTSFIQPCSEIADVSIDLMMRRIKNMDSSPLTVYLNGKIIERQSTVFH